MVLLSIVALVVMFIWFSKQKTISEGMKVALPLLEIIVSLVAFAGNGLIIGIVFCGLDDKKIEEKVRKRVEEKYQYLMGSDGGVR